MRILVLYSILLLTSGFIYADEENKEPVSVEYLALSPKIIVNLHGRKHYMRADVQLMLSGDDHIEEIQTHMPAIRHALIMLFSEHSAEDLATMEQRDELRKNALQAVTETLEKYANASGLLDLFFTEFLVQ